MYQEKLLQPNTDKLTLNTLFTTVNNASLLINYSCLFLIFGYLTLRNVKLLKTEIINKIMYTKTFNLLVMNVYVKTKN